MGLVRYIICVGLSFLRFSRASFWYPDATTSLLETILVQTHGAFNSGFIDAITPCTNYVSGPQTLGRETAAQWIKVAFQDFITANLQAGTGGIDASIGFETFRVGNTGTSVKDSLTFFTQYMSADVSMADLIAMSVVLSVGNCHGPQIPARGGRVDAVAPSPLSVPAPDTDLETTLGLFSRAGFNQSDAIQLTTCGHTIGAVHHNNFPTVISESAVSQGNTDGSIHFDSTPDVFDNQVVQEYISGTGQMGGPLVTSFNVSSRSDLRLYSSDNNATIHKLATQGSSFLNTCANMLQRMIETVPKAVILSDIIHPQPIKPINLTLDLDYEGTLFLTGVIRILSNSPPSVLNISYHYVNTVSSLVAPNPAKGSSIYGTTTYYPFGFSLGDGTLSLITVAGSGLETQNFQTPSGIFIVPSMTAITGTLLNVTVASLAGSLSPTFKVVVSVLAPQNGTQSPRIKKFSMEVALIPLPPPPAFLTLYGLFSGTIEIGLPIIGVVTVDVIGNANGQIIDKILIG